MSLRWSLEECKDYEELTKDKLQMAINDALIWGTMNTGIPKITEKNYKEFYYRYELHTVLYGPAFYIDEDFTPYKMTVDDVKRRIGLSTNASELTTSQFFNDLKRRLKETIERSKG